MFSAAKDAMTGAAARKFLNGRIERYGSVRELKIDSRAQTVEAVCELQGEAAPITVRVGRYEVEEQGQKKFVKVTGCVCNRAWLQHLLQDFVEDKRFEVPGWASAAL
jgi:hypothetical protein